MPKIYQLDRHVADLIAAGEVVERPASAAKELVENAIDAGARSVTVEIKNGGMTFLRVTDNGCGMSAEDAQTAFLRHATSKIRTKEDLAAITTLGFRGEALAAISSVSRVDLLTKAADCEGVSLHLEAGNITSRQSAGCPDGTTIIVRDLFFNTPARMKFMKTDAAEAAAVSSVLQQQALAHPDVSIRFLKDGQEQFHTSGDGERMSAVYTLFGRDLANGMLTVDGHWEKTSVRGFVTKPTATRGNRTWQFFFVNGRFVKSRLLSAALEEAYKNQMMSGRYPACVLEILLPAAAVDVNVHPAKTEVRFLNERDVFDAVHYAVLATLGKASGRPEMSLPQEKTDRRPAASGDFFKSMTAGEFRSAQQNSGNRQPQKPSAAPVQRTPESVRSDLQQILISSSPVQAAAAQAFSLTHASGLPEETLSGKDTGSAVPPAAADTKPEPPAPVPEQTPPCAPVPQEDPRQEELAMETVPHRVIGEVLNTYIIVEQGEDVLFIDKHAAHERINFECLKAEDHPFMSQMLLAPLPAELSREEAEAVLEHRDFLDGFGFEVDDFGDGDVVLRRIPSDIPMEEAVPLIQKLAGDLLSGKTLDAASLRDSVLHTISCKAAIKAGWHTEAEERDYLVEQVLSRDDIKYCPHGRPVCITLSRKHLEKQFRRS